MKKQLISGLAAALAAGMLAGCGGSSDELARPAADALHAAVDDVRAAAQDADRAEALQALNAFRAEVRRLLASGAIDPVDANALLAHADSLEAGLPEPAPKPAPATEAVRTAPVKLRAEPVRAELTRALALWRAEFGKGDGGRHGKGKHGHGKGGGDDD